MYKKPVSLSMAFCLLFSLLPFSWLNVVNQTAQAEIAPTQAMLDNGLIRLGDPTDDDSVNIYGQLQEPHHYVYSPGKTHIQGLTDGDDLVQSFAVGGDGTEEWNLNGTVVGSIQVPLDNVVVDRSGFVSTGDGKGYGTIISTGTRDIEGTTLEFKNEYSLGPCTPYARVLTTIKNVGEAPATNVRYWSTVVYDDELEGDNSPQFKGQGFLVDGKYVQSTIPGERTTTVKISTPDPDLADREYFALVYSPDKKAFAFFDDEETSDDRIRLLNNNPFLQPTTEIINDSGSYGIFKRMNDLAVGESDTLEWYSGGTHTDTMSFEDLVALMSQGDSSYNKKCVSFKSNGGTPISTTLVNDGSAMVKPTDPTRNVHKFEGWFTDEALTTAYNFANPVTSSFSLYAKWTLEATLDLSSSRIAESEPSGSKVGTLSTTPSLGDGSTYQLVAGEGDTDNGSFMIESNPTDGTWLSTATALDYETKSSYSVRVAVTNGSITFAKAFTITLTDVNENASPTDISLNTSTVAENVASGTTVGTLSATDADSGDTATFSLVAGDGDTDNVSFTIDGTTLKAAASFDYETKSNYSIRVRVTDSKGEKYEESFTISVTNVNEAPTDISVTASTVAENAASGTTVGTLSAVDVDSSDTATFSLVAGDGDTDNGSFTIDGTSLKTAASFDYETKSSYSIRIRVTDIGDLSYEKLITISITDVNEFKDVPKDAWYATAVNYLGQMNIVQGDGIGNARPFDKLTRAEFIKMVVATFEIDSSSTEEMNFKDVVNDKWYYESMQVAWRAGIIKGFGDSTVKPNQAITRQDMMVILHRALLYKSITFPTVDGPKLSDIKDASMVSAFAVSALNDLIRYEIVKGSSGKLRPLDIALRAEGQVILYRALMRFAG